MDVGVFGRTFEVIAVLNVESLAVVEEAKLFRDDFNGLESELKGLEVDDGEDVVGGVDGLSESKLLVGSRKPAAEIRTVFDIVDAAGKKN